MAEADAPDDNAEGVMAKAANSLFLHIEHVVYIGLAAILSAAALAGLVGAVITFLRGTADWTSSAAIFIIIDRLLFVLLLVEILHTVRASIRTGGLAPEPFIVVGLIASIRRVLVITLQTSEATKPGVWTPENHAFVRDSMLELSVVAVLILILVASLCLLIRWSGAQGQGSHPDAGHG
jgi:uncharacterized membrane protein (DUF373 family)